LFGSLYFYTLTYQLTMSNLLKTTLQKRLASFGFAFKGLATLFRTQPNARIHLLATMLVIGFGFWLQITPFEWALVALCIGMVFAAEAFNSALEFLTDLVSPEYHELAGKTKDLAAAGVLLTAGGTAAVGLLIFGPKLWQVLFMH
jgi:diacylglycerol kinase (ATP)